VTGCARAAGRVVKVVASATLTRDPAKIERLALHHPRYLALASADHRCRLWLLRASCWLCCARCAGAPAAACAASNLLGLFLRSSALRWTAVPRTGLRPMCAACRTWAGRDCPFQGPCAGLQPRQPCRTPVDPARGRYALPRELREFKVVCAGADKPLAALALLQALGAERAIVFTGSVQSTQRCAPAARARGVH